MSITINTANGISVIHLSGRLTQDGQSRQFRDIVNQLIEGGTKNILVVMKELSYVDSTGLGELVMAFSRVTNKGGQLALVNPSRRVTDLLQITKILTVFQVFHDSESALAALSGQSKLGATDN